jgi:HlyD family secretion protein
MIPETFHRMLKIAGASFFLLFLLNACQKESGEPDAYGSFEADTRTVTPEIAGRIQELNVQEGKSYEEGAPVAWTDTSQLHLKKERIRSEQRSIRSERKTVQAQLRVHDSRIDHLTREIDRFRPLVESGGATQKQVDDLLSKREVAQRKKELASSKLARIEAKAEALDKRIAQVDDRIRKCRIELPVKGTVLDLFKEEEAFLRPGSPILRMAPTDHLEFKAFITGTQLPEVETGEDVTVRVDRTEDDFINFPGTITWIAEEAEFSPKNIKTKEERANLVYAIEVRVPNDGRLKIGMPGELLFER